MPPRVPPAASFERSCDRSGAPGSRVNSLRPFLPAALCLLLGISALGAQEAARDPRAHTLELGTDMLRFDQPSTRLFLGWHRDVNALFRAGLDGTTVLLDLRRPGPWIERLGLLAVFAATNAAASRAFSITAHDQAHMEAALAIGASRAYLVHTSDPSVEMGIWEFLLEAFDPTREPGLYTYVVTAPTARQMAYVAGEGLDTNLLIAATIAAAIDEGDGHVMDVAPYMLNKLWGVGYFQETGPTSDAVAYIGDLDQQGQVVSAQRVITLQAVSLLASGGFLSLVRGVIDFAADGRASVQPLALELGGASLCWPEVTTWLNPDNVSVQVSTRIRWGQRLVWWAGVDVPALGAGGAPELTLGCALGLGPVRLEGEATDRDLGFPFVRCSLELDVGGGASIGAEGFYGQGATMRELREYPAGPGVSAILRARL